MGLFDIFRKNKSEPDLEDSLDMLGMLHQALSDDGGVDADELPNGYGRFGLDVSNPIPCKTLLGSMAYLERLHTIDGAKVVAERVGSFNSDVVDSPIDGYDLTHPDGSDLGMIYISPYQARISQRAPDGFKLA